MAGKSHDNLEWLEQLQLRAVVAAEEQVDALKRIAVAVEQQNAQNAQLARFIGAISRVMAAHEDCDHDDSSLWLGISNAGDEILGPNWLDETD